MTTINYAGTKAQWEEISKTAGDDWTDAWDKNTGSYTVVCSDGIIAK